MCRPLYVLDEGLSSRHIHLRYFSFICAFHFLIFCPDTTHIIDVALGQAAFKKCTKLWPWVKPLSRNVQSSNMAKSSADTAPDLAIFLTLRSNLTRHPRWYLPSAAIRSLIPENRTIISGLVGWLVVLGLTAL